MQLDALYCEVKRLLSPILHHAKWARSRTVDHATMDNVRKAFRRAVEPKTTSEATTTARMDALRQVFDLDLDLPKRRGHAAKIRACLKHFRALERKFPQEKLSVEDSNALQELAAL